MKYYKVKETGKIRSEERMRIIFKNNEIGGNFDNWINQGLKNGYLEDVPEEFIIKD